MPTIPVAPQPDHELRARFPDAIKRLWVIADLDAEKDRPGLHREHIFDTTDGFRFIVSRDQVPDAGIAYHVSVSCSSSTLLKKIASIDQLHLAASDAFYRISGWSIRLDACEVHFTEGTIPHYFIPCMESPN